MLQSDREKLLHLEQELGRRVAGQADEALTKIGKEGFDPTFGARPLKRVLQRRVLNALSKAILSGDVKKDSVVLMELNDDGEIAFTNLDAEIEL